jgi:death on curing protein
VIQMLSTEDVLAVHKELVRDFSDSDDPISPSGVRSEHLLESAILRQSAGFGTRLKFDTPVSNAVTLAYGLCMNHPFFNGNKRTSLVALLCHLDRNWLTFHEETSQSELYDFMLKLAKHEFGDGGEKHEADLEIDRISRWVRKRVRKIERGERVVTFRELRRILESHGYIMENFAGNFADLVRERERVSWFGLRRRTVRARIMSVPFPGGGQVVGKGLLKEIRLRCELDEACGVDSQAFYEQSRAPDFFIARYRKTLRRLARV